MRQDEQPGDASWFTAELKEPGDHSGKADDSRFVEHFIHGECTMEECAGASPEWCYITHAREVNPFSRQIPTALDARPRFHQPCITSPCSTSSYGPRMATHGMPLVPSPAATTGRSPPELRDYIEGGDFGPGQVLADTNSRRYTIGSLRIDRFDLSGHNSGIRRYATDSSDDAPATGTASTYFFCVNTTIFFHNRDNDRTQFFTATKWMHQLARAYVIPVIHTIATQLVRTPSTTMSTTPPRESFSTFSLSRAFGSLADTRHCAIGSHTPSTTMSTTPPMDSDLTHIEGPERLTKRVTVARLEPYVDSSRGGTSGQSPARLPSHSLS